MKTSIFCKTVSVLSWISIIVFLAILLLALGSETKLPITDDFSFHAFIVYTGGPSYLNFFLECLYEIGFYSSFVGFFICPFIFLALLILAFTEEKCIKKRGILVGFIRSDYILNNYI